MNTVNGINENSFGYVESIKKLGRYAGLSLAALVFAVAHPIIGSLGSIGCLLAAGYHGIHLNYHWRHSREKDQNGNLIPGTELNQLEEKSDKYYENKNAKFNSEDLPRLQNELQRLYHLNAAIKFLEIARGLAKCCIPIAGPFWAFFSEGPMGGTPEDRRCHSLGCIDDWHHLTPEKMVENHIAKLTRS